MVDRSVRSLEHLETSASTARVLNLRMVAKRKSNDPEYNAHPLFKNASLNTSIIVKHRLRPNELEQFPTPRRSATKILVPIEVNDLRLGARYVFIGQRRFEQSLYEAFGIAIGSDSADLRTLNILDETPTLDPFLLREQLRRHNLEPARCYFELSQADTQRMFDFAQREIEPLVRMSVGSDAAAHTHAAKLTRKILANSADADLEPLRQTMQLDKQQFQEGVFCWKAFLYYKWQLADLLPRVSPILQEIETIRPRGPQSADIRTYLKEARETLRKALIASCRAVKTTLEIYDSAYANLTQNSDPTAFRDFLLRAPDMFNDLGERLGGIEHILSFWRFRFPGGKLPVISPEELADMFLDFEGSVGAIEIRRDTSRIAPPTVIDAT
jgi:hypothetical protein